MKTTRVRLHSLGPSFHDTMPSRKLLGVQEIRQESILKLSICGLDVLEPKLVLIF